MALFNSNQEVFDHIANHLITQKRRSANEYGECLYRHKLPDGTVLKCAIGAIIPDWVYSRIGSEIEKSAVPDIGQELVQYGIISADINIVLLRDLQVLHDNLNS
jgi:hypothetical protein